MQKCPSFGAGGVPERANGGTKRRFGEVFRRFIAFGGIWERIEENRKFEFLANFGHFGTWPSGQDFPWSLG